MGYGSRLRFAKRKMPLRWSGILFGAGYGSRTRPVCLGSRNSTDKLTLRFPHYSKGDMEIQPLFVEAMAISPCLCYDNRKKE